MQYIVLAKTGNEKIVLSTYLLSNSQGPRRHFEFGGAEKILGAAT